MYLNIKQLARNLLNRHFTQWICGYEFYNQRFVELNERPIEYGFVFNKLAEICPRDVLDVGTGSTALPHLIRNCGFVVTATDNVRDYWPSGMVNRHYYVIDDDITATRLSKRFEVAICVSVLEHILKPDEAVQNMFSLLKSHGHLILTFPYTEDHYIKNVYELPNSSRGKGSPFITQSYSRAEISQWAEDNQAVIVSQEYWQFWEGDYWTAGDQVIPPRRVSVKEKHQLTCLQLQKAQ